MIKKGWGGASPPPEPKKKADCHLGPSSKVNRGNQPAAISSGMKAPPFEYRYRAANPRVIDGDTVDCDVDLGFRIRTQMRFRLLGINAPEKTRADIRCRHRGDAAP